MQSIGLSVQEKKFKIDFQDSYCGCHLIFQIRMIFRYFDLQVNLMLSTKFRVNWHFGSGEAQNRLPRQGQWRLSWISNQKDFSFFFFTSHPDASYRFKPISLSVQQKKRKTDFQDGPHGSHFGYSTGKI